MTFNKELALQPEPPGQLEHCA